MITYTLKVIDIKRETNNVITICFKQPALRKIKYKAGQYLTLIFRINGRRYVRPYSFSSAPLDSNILEVSVKRVPFGVVSNHIHDIVKIGDAMEVMEPMGDFVFENDGSVSEVYFWGVGSGITPIISIIKETLLSDSSVKLNLIYGNRNYSETIFLDKITNLLTLYPERFEVFYLFTGSDNENCMPNIFKGRINHDFALNILSGKDLAGTRHYICGPAEMKDSVKESLMSFLVPRNNILSEDFELEKDVKDLVDIFTKDVTIRFENIEHLLEVVKGKSILAAALDAGIELPYSCQTGTCNLCKARLVSGSIKTIGADDERHNLKDDERLLCCSYPLSDEIKLEI